MAVALQAEIAELAASVEWSFAEAHEETGSPWPAGCCVEASLALHEELEEHVPSCLPVYVFGEFHIWPGLSSYCVGHAWVLLRDDTIVDITARQFSLATDREFERVTILAPDDPLRAHWRESDPR